MGSLSWLLGNICFRIFDYSFIDDTYRLQNVLCEYDMIEYVAIEIKKAI